MRSDREEDVRTPAAAVIARTPSPIGGIAPRRLSSTCAFHYRSLLWKLVVRDLWEYHVATTLLSLDLFLLLGE